jgi:phosphoserine phosphatase
MTSSHALTVFLVRHGQTTWNAISRYQGRLDPPLSEIGDRQMEAVANLVFPGAFDLVYSSPLKRTRVLAGIIAQRAEAPVRIDDRLIEINLGAWQGMHREEIEREYADMFHTWYDRPDLVQFPAGENLAAVWDRVGSFMTEVFESGRDVSRVCVVTHDVVIKVALMQSLGIPTRHLHRFRLHNASISVLRGTSPVGSVEAVDVTDHLTGSPLLLPE